MIRTFFTFSFTLFLLLYCEASAASALLNLHPVVTLGSGYTTTGHSQHVWLANTPDPGLENTYSTTGQQQDTSLVGLALENTFKTNLKNIESSIGIEMDYLRNNSLIGVVHPMVNVDPEFDTLNYSYRMKSYLLLGTAKLSLLNLFPYLGAYLQAGVGSALNKLSNYTETSPPGSSAAPMLEPFGNASHKSFAYSISAGIICQVSKSAQVLIGYRYINSGMGTFKSSSLQQTNNTLKFSPLGHHFLTLSVLV